MARLQHQVVLPYQTMLPTDVSTNTFYSNAPLADRVEQAAEFSDLLAAQYETLLTQWISGIVTRATNGCMIVTYDIDDPKPRAPILVQPFTATAPGSLANMPLEVACCLSFQAAGASGSPQARRRGRIFLGPLHHEAQHTASNAPSVPTDALIEDLLTAGTNLQAVGLVGATWSVFSRVDDAFRAVTNGWVDNEFDTMRSRQLRATERLTFPLIP